MPRKAKLAEDLIPERPPAMTPEGRDAMLTAYAYDLVEKRLREGTASSQETTFFLKLGSQREKLEMERLRKENEMLQAKTKAIASEQERAEIIACYNETRGELESEASSIEKKIAQLAAEYDETATKVSSAEKKVTLLNKPEEYILFSYASKRYDSR